MTEYQVPGRHEFQELAGVVLRINRSRSSITRSISVRLIAVPMRSQRGVFPNDELFGTHFIVAAIFY